MPVLQDADIQDLCSQFSQKAKCDGSKLVIEPEGIEKILESLHQKKVAPNSGLGPTELTM